MVNATEFDILWVVIAAALVMLMQGGFTLLETGMVRAKNSINVAIKNFVDFCVSAIIFWVFGFAIMFGASAAGIFGTSGFLFGNSVPAYLMAFFLFQLIFAGTATTIVSGAVAERMSFLGYLITTIVIASVIYPVVGHWIWGGLVEGNATGWLARRGFFDFAGGTVVHSVGGWVALAAVIILGAREGRFEAKGSTYNANNLPLSTLGALVLWFGWFGFNGGSTLGITDQIPLIIVNTVMAGAFGGVAGLAASYASTRQAEVSTTINGALGGLVAITTSANIQSPATAVLIGAIAGVVVFSIEKLLYRLRIDDAVGAVAVHAGAGVWGALAVAIFGNPALFGSGLGRGGQLAVQMAGIITVFVYAFGLSFLLLWLLNRFVALRVSPEDERRGLNVAEHGARTALLTLLEEMEEMRVSADLTQRVTVEPFTEVGEFAAQYNRVLQELERSVTRTQAENDRLQSSVFQLLQDVTQLAEGDLTIRAAVTNDATGAVADSFNFMAERLRQVIGRVQAASQRVGAAANEILTTANQLNEGAVLQAEQILNTSAAVDEMSVSISQVSDNATLSALVGEEARANASEGAKAVRDTIENMRRIRQEVEATAGRIERLERRSREIGNVTKAINALAERTGILAINASIQASEAGEAGRGFAVVARQVEELAVQSAESAAQINAMLRAIQDDTREAVNAMATTSQEVQAGSELASEAGERLGEIETVSTQLADLIAEISQAARQQARGSESIARSMNDIEGVTQQTATGSERASKSIGYLAQLAEELQASVSTFKLSPSIGD